MRRYFEPITVRCDSNGTPARIVWRGRMFHVLRVQERWRYRGKWWLTGWEGPRHYYRLEARPHYERQMLTPPRSIEVFKQGEKWILSYLFD